jgi:hypothetical protein
MIQRGRPTSAVSIVKRLRGTSMAKERLLVILENLGGTLPVAAACRRIHFGRTLFRRNREAMLVAALRALEPRPRGRPARHHPVEGRRIRELEAKIERLEEDLALTRVREELALVVPWTQRQKKNRAFRAFWRAAMPPSSPADTIVAATPGPRSPVDSA